MKLSILRRKRKDTSLVLSLPGDGDAYPNSVILDVGSAAIDRASTGNEIIGRIDLANAADYTGFITSVQIWAASNITGMRVGTFYLVSGTTYTCRDSVTIGAVTAGSLQTFGGLNLSVVVGDLIGCYFATGSIELSTSGGSGIKAVAGEFIDPGDSTDYGATIADRAISLFAVGTGISGYAGSIIRDVSGYGNNGTIAGATWVRLPSGLWVNSFDGVDDSIRLPGLTSFFTTEATLIMWMKVATNDYVLGKNGFCYLSTAADGEYPFLDGKYYINTFRANRIDNVTNSNNRTVWNMQTITTKPGANGWNWYHNLNLVKSDEGEATVALSTYAGNGSWIGTGATGISRHVDGYIGLIRIFNRALSALEIANIYNQERSLF